MSDIEVSIEDFDRLRDVADENGLPDEGAAVGFLLDRFAASLETSPTPVVE
jgi:hypothetical protein